MKKYLLGMVALFISLLSFGQGDAGTGEFFKSNLKIYVVVAVLTIILILIFVFLFSMEKRLNELEKKK